MEILVTREKDRFSSILIERGFPVINFPLIETEPLADLSELENLLSGAPDFDGIFITSFQAAKIIVDKLAELKKNFSGKFYVLGKKSDALLKQAGLETRFEKDANTAEEFLKMIPLEELKGKNFLFARGNLSLRVVPEKLKNLATVTETIVYRTKAAQTGANLFNKLDAKFRKSEIRAICFFSPSAVTFFSQKFEVFEQNAIQIAAIGKTTARAVENERLRVDFVSPKTEPEIFADEFIKFLRK